MDDKTTAFLSCSCSGVNHVLQLRYYSREPGEDYSSLFLSAVMPYPRPWWNRVWLAIKYIFKNSDCGYLGFEHVYTPEGAKKQIAILQMFLDSMEKKDG